MMEYDSPFARDLKRLLGSEQAACMPDLRPERYPDRDAWTDGVSAAIDDVLRRTAMACALDPSISDAPSRNNPKARARDVLNKLWSKLSDASGVPVEVFKRFDEWPTDLGVMFISILTGNWTGRDGQEFRTFLEKSRATELFGAESCDLYGKQVLDLVVSGTFQRAVREVFEEDLRKHGINEGASEVMHVLAISHMMIFPMYPCAHDSWRLGREFLAHPEVVTACKQSAAPVISVALLWQEKARHEVESIWPYFDRWEIAGEIIFTAEQARDRSLLHLTDKLLADLPLLELLELMPAPPNSPRLQSLSRFEDILIQLRAEGIEGSTLNVLAGCRPSHRLDVLDDLLNSESARSFLLRDVNPLRVYRERVPLIEERAAFWQAHKDSHWAHDDSRTLCSTIGDRTANLPAIDQQWLTSKAPELLCSPCAKQFETLLTTKRDPRQLFEMFASLPEGLAQSVFLDVALSGEANVKGEVIARKIAEFDEAELAACRASGDDWIKSFWRYKRPKEVQCDLQPRTERIAPKAVSQSTQTVRLKGAYWIDELKENHPTIADDLSIALELLPAACHGRLRSLFKRFGAEKSLGVIQELATLLDENQKLGAALLGSTRDINRFADFVENADQDLITTFRRGHGDYQVWMNRFLNHTGGRSVGASVPQFLLSTGDLASVNRVQIVTNLFPPAVLEKRGSQERGAIFIFNPDESRGATCPDGFDTLVITDKQHLDAVQALGFKEAHRIILEDSTLEDMSLVVEFAREQLERTSERSALYDQILIPERYIGEVRQAWKRLDPRHQRIAEGYLGRVAAHGSCGTFKRLKYVAQEFYEIRLLTASGPRVYLYPLKGADTGKYLLVRIGDKGSQDADLRALDRLDPESLAGLPAHRFSDL